MLAIRKEQLDTLNAAMRERFIEKTLLHLREVFPEKTKAQEAKDLRAQVEGGIKRAASYRITGEREVTLFIDLLFGLGQDFDGRREFLRLQLILRDRELSQTNKMDLIYKKLEKANLAPHTDPH
jgi:hypothetical protein